ncbi:MAG TPA: 50S ribosomal protein L23 [Candidatus Paceibacterota bacterium]|nr:50S ribosomal protein L23 [Candidatus Paceibacterota bacterium]
MAIFGTKKTNTAVAQNVKDVRGKLATALIAPWLSEKALIATEKGVYAFHVPADATKHDVMLAIERTYKVTPRQVRMVNLPAKKVSLRTRRGFGTKSGRRKAYVYLKKGDTIQFA